MSNIDIVKSVYSAFAAGDVPGVLGLMDEKIQWEEPEGVPYEDQVGPQAVAENVFMRVTQDVADFSVVPDEYVDGGDTIVAIGVYRGKGAKTGKTLEAPFTHVWKVKGGKLAYFRTYTDSHLWREVLGV